MESLVANQAPSMFIQLVNVHVSISSCSYILSTSCRGCDYQTSLSDKWILLQCRVWGTAIDMGATTIDEGISTWKSLLCSSTEIPVNAQQSSVSTCPSVLGYHWLTAVMHQTHLVQWTWNILSIWVYPGVSDECDPRSSHPSHENQPSLWRRILEDGLSWCEKWVQHVIAIHRMRRLSWRE